MNLRHIIRESINNVILDSIISEAIEDVTNDTTNGETDSEELGTTQPVNQQQTVNFNQYADELHRIVGNNGISVQQVSNNPTAIQHITTLNNFVFAVIDAIDSGNIESVSSPAAGNNNTRWSNNPYMNKIDHYRKGMKDAVGFLTKYGEKTLGTTNINGNPFTGVFDKFNDGYNQMHNLVGQQIDRKRYADMYDSNKQTGNGGSGLVYLMQGKDYGCYPQLVEEYRQINIQNNGVFNAIPNVLQCYQVLQELAYAVINYQKLQKQNAVKQPVKQQQQNQPQPEQNQPQTEQQMLEGFAKELMLIDGDGTALQRELESAENHNMQMMAYFIKQVGEVTEYCVTAIENGIIRWSDVTNDQDYPLTYVMSTREDSNEFTMFKGLCRDYLNFGINEDLPKDTTTNKLFQTLNKLSEQMKAYGINDEIDDINDAE